MRRRNTLTLLLLFASPPAFSADDAWLPFDPKPDAFSSDALLDLRSLNEKFAGEHGPIAAKDGRFVHSKTGEPVRFWAVNGPPGDAKDPAELRRVARTLAKRGVNLVRRHGPLFDKDGEVDPKKIEAALAVVEAMKGEGIYTLFSIYFPLWLTPRADHSWLEGYDGKKHPFAALMFNAKFQEKYRGWWKALLHSKSATTGRRLVDDPALMGLEIQNEDSFFFWTFNPDAIPDAQLKVLETQFAAWLKTKHGSLEAALAAWKGPKVKRDAPAEGRIGFRPLWNVAHEKTVRDQETVAFLLETQTRFYRETERFLRELGFKGLVTASNWATASPEVLGPLEKLSYTEGDFIDRHGYFGCAHKGKDAEWSVRDGHTYADRSALRFDPESQGKPKEFVHTVMDPQYGDLPSMVSETTFNRPNRYRSEAPLYFAAFGALQESDAIVHFALDGGQWAVKPGYFMQPWTLMTPAMMGQFPAAALIFRRGLVEPGRVLAEIRLSKAELRALKGTPLPQDASFDELRQKDVPASAELKPGQRIDPLIHYAGRVVVRFVEGLGSVRLEDLKPLVDHQKQTVTSTTGQLKLDYAKGVLAIDAPRAQGVSGALSAAGQVALKDLSIESDLELGHIVAGALDGEPLSKSRHILLQAMSEERSSGFETEAVDGGSKRIKSIGRDPWQIRALSGTVRFNRADAAQMKVTRLDPNGEPAGEGGDAREIRLDPRTIYYIVGR